MSQKEAVSPMPTLSRQERRSLWVRMGLRLALLLAFVLLLWGLGPTLWKLFAPFLLALPVAWVLSPAVRRLHDRSGVPEKYLTALLLLVVFGLLGFLLWNLSAIVVREVVSLARNWETLVATFQTALDRLEKLFSRLSPGLSLTSSGQVVGWLKTAMPQVLSRAVEMVTGTAKGLPSFLLALIFFLLASYFLTADYTRLRSSVTKRLPSGTRLLLSLVKRATATGMGGYLRAQLVISSGVFLIILVGFLITKQEYALLLAFGLAVLYVIPILGAGTGLCPWMVADLFLGRYRHALGLVVIWVLVSLFRRLGEPKVLGDQTGLPPVTTLVSIYVGMKLMGVAGMLLGPIVCLIWADLCSSGLLEPAWRDLRLAFQDLVGILSGEEKP